MMKGMEPLPPELVALVEKLTAELPNLPDDADAQRRFEWLLDVLIMRGQLPESFRRLAAKVTADRTRKVRLNTLAPNKYDVVGPDIDCASLIPLCGARCCSFEVALSEQDVTEGGVPWVLDEPYVLPRDPQTKRCTCMNAAGACTIYDARPATCRDYDCREDKRVWLDFANKVIAPR